ncbi:hypothetical protein WJU23_08245 [Prosthecobacter sp. SYSU 5D2]|uniref:hypothetical protein n=1 Tax=Prosthecobacter sp. SYSU 5D2 TaxID=3134134 RepID=UPI0031FEDCBC
MKSATSSARPKEEADFPKAGIEVHPNAFWREQAELFKLEVTEVFIELRTSIGNIAILPDLESLIL